MSEATSVLADLLAAGASIWADNGELVVEAKPGVVTPEIKAALTQNKAELLLMLEQERGVSPAEWKAAMLNHLFREQGTSGQPGRITAATVRHGEKRKLKRRAH